MRRGGDRGARREATDSLRDSLLGDDDSSEPAEPSLEAGDGPASEKGDGSASGRSTPTLVGPDGRTAAQRAAMLSAKWKVEAEDADDDAEVFNPHKRPKRRNGWGHAVFLLLGDVLGIGIVEIPGNFRVLGWFWGSVSLSFFAFMTLYFGMLVGRLTKAFPAALTFADLAYPAGGKRAYRFAYVMQHSYLILSSALYVLLGGKTIQYILYDTQLCLPQASMIMIAVLILPAQLRQMYSISYIAALSFFAIILYTGLCVFQIVQDGAPQTDTTSLWVESDSQGLFQIVSALMGFQFAFSGLEVYVEIIAEMRNPADFPLALSWTIGIVTAVYFVVAVVVYRYFGNETDFMLTAVLRHGWMLRLANFCMLLHIVVTYVIKQQVVLRAFHLKFWPESANDRTWAASVQWGGMSIGVLTLSFLLANAIPFFADFCSLLGALMDTTICFIFPAIVVLNAYKLMFMRMAFMEVPALYSLLSITLVVGCLGVVSAVHEISSHWQSMGFPFSCQAIDDSRETSFVSIARSLTTLT